MITRKTLALFGCHADAVEQFAREAGLPVERKPPYEFKAGDWVRVQEGGFPSASDRSVNGWVGQIARRGVGMAVDGYYVTFHGRPVPVALMCSELDGTYYMYAANLVPA